MKTKNWLLSSSGSSDWQEQVVSDTKTLGDFAVTFQPKFFIIKVTADTYVKFISANSDVSILSDDTESTGVVLTGGNEYTFDPMEESVYKVKIAGVTGATSVRISCGRYIQQYETQIAKKAK